VVYDPAVTSYERLLEIFWHNIDPTQSDGQFCDRGDSYRSAIFYGSAEEQRRATETKTEVRERLGEDVATAILPASTFWVAEDYHQDFYRKDPARYQSYREGCGRDRRLREIWGESAGGAH
jgi:peptide-methionine (S)-S-oxide reductase